MLLVIIMLLSALLVLHVSQYNQTKELLELLGERGVTLRTPDEPVNVNIVGCRILLPVEHETHEESIDFSDALYDEHTAEKLAQYAEEQAKIPPSGLTDYELARLERDNEFDLRIARIKDELARELPDARRGHDAPIFMAGIENLPHDIIRDTEKEPPDVEITI